VKKEEGNLFISHKKKIRNAKKNILEIRLTTGEN
jgi:hypothetical protein